MAAEEGLTTEDDYEGPGSAQPLSASDRSVFDDVDG
jgi:hypothetical protein